MDRKSIIILVISLGLLMSWPVLMKKAFPPSPVPTNMVARATNQVAATTNVAPAPGATNAAVTNVAAVRPPSGAFTVPSGVAEKVEVVTNENARYSFTSFGGGLKLVELLNYPEVVKCRGAVVPTNNLAKLNENAPAPVLAMRDGAEDGVFQLTRIPGGMRAEKQLSNGLYIVKEYRPGTNFLLTANVFIENRSQKAIEIPQQEFLAGTSVPMGQENNPQFQQVFWYNGSKEASVDASWFANHMMGCACLPSSGGTRTLYQEGNNNVVWSSAQNQFFTLAVIPKEPAQRIFVTEVELPGLSGTNATKAPAKVMALQAALAYPAVTVQPGQKVERQFTIYAGPKEYKTLQRIGLMFKNNLDLLMNIGGFWGFFSKILLLSMNGLHALGLSYALAIIAITVIIKLVFWPLTQASTRSMKRMGQLQPQIKALQAKYKDDPSKMNRKMMEFMKENKVNPMGGCLPMLIQIPVFFGFYRMIQNAIELRGAQFLWVCDLSKPDTLFSFSLGGFNIPINPLPLLMGVTMLWQARMTPASPGMDPVQQRMMKYMPLMFLVLLYNFSAGLTLYWTVQNLLTIAQMKLTKASGTAKNPPTAPAGRK